MLPRDELNNGVTMTLRAIAPAKKGKKDQALCGNSLNRKAGRCQKPQTIPTIIPAHSGASLR